METNEKIKHIRLQHNMTQNEFAASLGISRSALTQLEAGHTKPSFDVLEALIDQFDVDITTFFNASVPEKKSFDDVLKTGQKVKRILKFYDDQYGLRYNMFIEERLVKQVADGLENREQALMMRRIYDLYVVLKNIVADIDDFMVDPLKRYANKLRKHPQEEENDDRMLRSPDAPEVQEHLNQILAEVTKYFENNIEVLQDIEEALRKDGNSLGDVTFFTNPVNKFLHSSREEYLRHFEILLTQVEALPEVERYYGKEHLFFWKNVVNRQT